VQIRLFYTLLIAIRIKLPYNIEKQRFIRAMRDIRTIFMVGLCLLVTACGVKPGSVSAPKGAEDNSFPRTYPNLETDPQPKNEE